MSSSPFRSYFPRNDARYHPLSRPFPFSFNPAPDLTPPPTFLSLSLSLFVSFPTSHIHTPLFAHDKCAPFACRVSGTPPTPSHTLQPSMVPILRVTPRLLPTLDTLGGPVSPGALASSTPPRLNSSAISRPRGSAIVSIYMHAQT